MPDNSSLAGAPRKVAQDAARFDPKRPIVLASDQPFATASSMVRQSQRQRRAHILAAIRRLLVDEGYKGVTVRRIAELSGHVVQTIYNLVGPRDHAIVEAVTDYTNYVGSLGPADLEDPAAMIRTIEWQGRSVMLAPDFTRQFCLIYFTDSRHIFYTYREQQIRNVHLLLIRQKRNGVLRRDVDCRQLARDLVTFSGAIFIEWADGKIAAHALVPRLRAGYVRLLAGVVSPALGGLPVLPF